VKKWLSVSGAADIDDTCVLEFVIKEPQDAITRVVVGLTTPNGKNRTQSSIFRGAMSGVIRGNAGAINWVSD
jgi:hypothetical protein